MSDCTDQYLTRAKTKANNQYESLHRALRDTLQYQGGWQVEQISFIAGSRSLNEQDLRKNLKKFQVPEAEASPQSLRWSPTPSRGRPLRTNHPPLPSFLLSPPLQRDIFPPSRPFEFLKNVRKGDRTPRARRGAA
jgi:hypothetical protein